MSNVRGERVERHEEIWYCWPRTAHDPGSLPIGALYYDARGILEFSLTGNFIQDEPVNVAWRLSHRAASLRGMHATERISFFKQ